MALPEAAVTATERTEAGWLLQLCSKLTKTIHKTGYKQEIETEMSLFWKHSLWSSMSTSTTIVFSHCHMTKIGNNLGENGTCPLLAFHKLVR